MVIFFPKVTEKASERISNETSQLVGSLSCSVTLDFSMN